MLMGENIARFWKEKGWTQAELGERLGVSNQAVSKWESGATMPDVMLLPALADAFGIRIDDLFSRAVSADENDGRGAELPWPDDQTVRVFQAVGQRILQSQKTNTCIEVIFPRNCNETTRQYFKGTSKNSSSEKSSRCFLHAEYLEVPLRWRSLGIWFRTAASTVT